MVDARPEVARVYGEAGAIHNRTALDQTLWFALDEAALWQDQEAARYGQADAGPPEQ